MTCPSFEDLSQFVDGELSPSAHSALSAHLVDCVRCEALATRLGGAVGLPGGAPGGGVGGTGCLSAERILEHLLGATGGAGAIAEHLLHCDGCVEQMAAMHRRLRRAGDIETPVPAAIALRARAAVGHAVEIEGSAAPRLRSLLTRLTRLPILVPTALAAGALLTVAVESQWPSSAPRELLRSLPPRRVEITAVQAPLRERPDAGAAVLATAGRGEVLEVRGEEPRWYRIVLSDGREGWVERHACE